VLFPGLGLLHLLYKLYLDTKKVKNNPIIDINIING